MKKQIVWLCDLTYTQQSISNDTIPYAIGGIASYVKANVNFELSIEVIKYPEQLIKKIDILESSPEEKPDFIGFSNYIWNINLSCIFANYIKKSFKEPPVVVFGGPNFPIDSHEQKIFLKQFPFIDIYIAKEGELPWLELIKYRQAGKHLNDYNELLDSVPNLALISKDNQLMTSKIERMNDIRDLVSPYKVGLLDEYLDGRLMPTIQTNRGCPFTCTFCTEGQQIWSRVAKKNVANVIEEIEYLHDKMMSLDAEKRRYDLLITDSNFGMFPEDIEICKYISSLQEKTGWPNYINVATGKNNKERVLEAATLLNGALSLYGSVQSLDEDILANIKRRNISVDAIIALAQSSSKIGANSLTELILALPGDSKKTHLTSLKTLVDAGFNFISLYQLLLLPGTEMSTAESIKKYEFKTKYRVLPRAFGYYKVKDKVLSTADIDEVVVSTKDLSFQDYVHCREIALIVNVFYNDSVFYGVKNLLCSLNLSIYDWLEEIHSSKNDFPLLDKFLNDYISETNRELWDSKEDLYEYVSRPENIDKFISGESGSNLLYKYKARSVVSCLDVLYDVTCKVTKRYISDSAKKQCFTGSLDLINDLIMNLCTHNRLRMVDLFYPSQKKITQSYKFNISPWIDDKKEGQLSFKSIDCLYSYLSKEITEKYKIEANYFHTEKQIQSLASYKNAFGDSELGVTRTLSRIFLKQAFKNYTFTNSSTKSSKYRQKIDKRLMQS